MLISIYFLYLPIHFINYKIALFSTASATGKSLHVDHVATSVNRPSVAKVLVEYDVLSSLLPLLWVSKINSRF